MKLTGIPLNTLPITVRELCLLMTKRPQMLFQIYRLLSAALVLGVVSSLLYMWLFSVMSHVQPIWTFFLGVICSGLSALVMQMVLTHDDSVFVRHEQKKRTWDGFSILVAVVTLPAYALAHVVRFRHLIKTRFPDPKKDVRYELFQTFFLDVIAWNRCVPSMNQFLCEYKMSLDVVGDLLQSRVSNQMTELKHHEDTLRDIAKRLHGELVMHPIGTIKNFSSEAILLEKDLCAWNKVTERLIPGMFLYHFHQPTQP